MIGNNRKKQHYVWKHYLKPWTIDGKQIWCKRNGKIFNTSLENIGQERYFYESYELNKFEDSMIKGLIKKMHPSTHSMHLSSYDIYCSTTENFEYFKKNGLEIYHSSIEGPAIVILDSLYNKDLSLLNIKQNRIDFCRFLGMQYTRTKRSQESVSSMLGKLPSIHSEYQDKFDPVKISKVLSLITANSIGSWIYSDANFYFIDNTTPIEFITGDQPIYNLEIDRLNKNEPPEKFKLYYPLSPNLALLITEENLDNSSATANEASTYNGFIYNVSNDQIYSRTKEIIEFYA